MTVELYPLPEFQIFRKNILHLWKERKCVVRIEAKVLTLLTTHDVIATVGKKVVLHPPSRSSSLLLQASARHCVYAIRYF